MAGIFNGPARGGTRGGKDQFSWDNVKADRDREYYLGHSVKALTGRWQKGKDVYWYTREVEREGEEAQASERAMVKQREQDLMMEALGIKPKAPKAELRPAQLDKADMQKLLQGGDDDLGAGTAAGTTAAEADRVQGLGFHASMTTGAIQAGEEGRETLAGMGGGGAPPQPGAQQGAAAAAAAARQQGGGGGGGGGGALTAEQIAEVKRLKRKEENKAAKRAKKEAKKHKKGKKEKKEKRSKRPRSSDSGSSSSGSEGDAPAVAAAKQFLASHGLSPRRGLGAAPPAAEEPRQERRGRSGSPAGCGDRRRSSPERRRRSRTRSRDARRRSKSPARRQQQRSRSPARRRRGSPESRRRRHDSPA